MFVGAKLTDFFEKRFRPFRLTRGAHKAASTSRVRGSYIEVGCGVFIQNGEITVVQDFR
jgi:hypothetical protein